MIFQRPGQRHRTRGFTILEMSMSIIIIGIVFTLALQGQNFLLTMRAFLTAYRLQQLQNAIKFYETEHLALPGDDAKAPRLLQRPPAVYFVGGGTVSFAGNGVIDGKLSDTFNANGEQFMAWRDLRITGALDGDKALTGASAMPENSFGGVFGIDEGNLGQTGGSLCMTKIPGRAAQIIDGYLDDGIIDKGKIVATARWSPVADLNHFDAPDHTAYSPEKEYIMCAPLMP